MLAYLTHVDPGDENDSERDDLCPHCGAYLPLDPIYGLARYACGDCWGGTDRDPATRTDGWTAEERYQAAWEEKQRVG